MMPAAVEGVGWRRARQEYRHRGRQCSRLLFVGFLPPGTHIEIRCPACGRMHVIHVPSAAELVDTEHEFGYDSVN